MNRDKLHDEWVQAKRLCRLSDDEVRMARELGDRPSRLDQEHSESETAMEGPGGSLGPQLAR